MLEFINKYIFGVAVPIFLISAGVFYIVLLKAFHITNPSVIIKALTKKNNVSGISPFKAVTLALAGTLGVGNIVGVSAAIILGGFGSVFWMWISALCAMLLKYAEIVLAMRHRRYDAEEKPYGAAMYYIKDKFSALSLPKLGNILAATFALLCILNALTMGSMIQSNAISESLEGVFKLNPVICGVFLSLFSLAILPRGTKAMVKFTEILVPLMSIGYILISLAIIIIKKDMLGNAIKAILSDAFSVDSASGGVLGFFLSRSLRFGTMRGLISNEAGCGTAPTAHAASNTQSAVEQGFWGIFEVFTDTILLCTMTALVVIINFGELKYKSSLIMLTIDAYSNVLGASASIFLSIAVLCFGFATIICWGHYGIESVGYFTKSKKTKWIFILIYSASVFVGAFCASEIIWSLADFAIGSMTLINLMMLCLMSREVKKETESYLKMQKIRKKQNKR